MQTFNIPSTLHGIENMHITIPVAIILCTIAIVIGLICAVINRLLFIKNNASVYQLMYKKDIRKQILNEIMQTKNDDNMKLYSIFVFIGLIGLITMIILKQVFLSHGISIDDLNTIPIIDLIKQLTK